MTRLDYLRSAYNILPTNDFTTKVRELAPTLEFEDGEVETMNLWVDGSTNELIYINEITFTLLLDTDPTKNKMYTQWLLDIVVGLTKKSLNEFEVFITEDLEKTGDYLVLFDANKRKKKFKELSAKNYATKNLSDPTNINQYTSLNQLFSAVYPFKPKVDLSELEGQLDYYVSIGEAEMPVKDDFYTIFIPKTLRASELFSFTSWCTARPGNSMFNKYTTEDKKPKGGVSDLYIVIENTFFTGQSDNIYQIHFESSQIMDKSDSTYKTIREDILDNNVSVKNFFYETLKSLCEEEYEMWFKSGNKSSAFGEKSRGYVKHVLEFGYSDILFDVLDGGIDSISYTGINISSLPNLTKFNKLKTLYLDNVGLTSIFDNNLISNDLEMLSIPRNKVETLPNVIGNCKNVRFINLMDNPLQHIPDSIKYLDPTMGGSLFRFVVPKTYSDIDKLKTLLPSVKIISS